MGLFLSSPDLRRLGTATEALLAPGSFATPAEWRREVNRAVLALFGADHALFQLPDAGEPFVAEEVEPHVLASLAAAAENGPGGTRYHDPRLARYHAMRRRRGGSVFTRKGNERVMGVAMSATPLYAEVLRPAGMVEFCGLHEELRQGDAMLWVSFRSERASTFGDSAPELLRLLLPAFRAGLAALASGAPGEAASAEELRARYSLTEREAEVAIRLAAGDSTKRLARSLGISVHTARHHTERVFAKLGVSSRRDVPRLVLAGQAGVTTTAPPAAMETSSPSRIER